MASKRPIGVFDSGYGGLTVFQAIRQLMPEYDFVYLGDNARAPYGNRTFTEVYQYTLRAIEWFFDQDCPLVILACNTASAKALRTIQMNDLPRLAPDNRVLGVIRPTAEVIGEYTQSGHIGVLGTKGTVVSGSYVIEINHFYPDIQVHQHACPLWVPLIESGAVHDSRTEAIVRADLKALFQLSPHIDCVLLACTHYPLIEDIIQRNLPPHVRLIAQGDLVAQKLMDYLARHTDLNARITKNSKIDFYTTGFIKDFDHHSRFFYGEEVNSERVVLEG